eukprot:TRINITY_DN423_c5_g1_i1.p1 TRINITY_DN423_c5_g1~~TRINITY_DN423_c5_g1_i1.p1  ORF type:complete len:365 (+),score=55.94 TRINITY_DN423_c5_g1_i1:89-1183(+)
MLKSLFLVALPAVVVGWSQMGDTTAHDRITAISMDFDFDTFPCVAFGYNVSDGRTNIPVVAWNGTGWVQEYERESQFAQGYHEFILKVRNNVKYIGLKIHYRFGSVLNGAVGYRGSYAFHNQLFGYDIDSQGDMVMLWISELATSPSYPGTDNNLVVIRYPQSGWVSYPAEDHFTDQIYINKQTETERVTDVKLIRAKTPNTFFGAYVLGGMISIFDDVRNAANPLGGSFPGTAMDITYSAKYGLFVSSFGTSNELEVHHMPEGSNDWVLLGKPIHKISERLTKTHIRVTENGIVVAACEHEEANIITVGIYSVEMPGQWIEKNVIASGPVTHWEMGVGGQTAYVAYSVSAKGLTVVRELLQYP